MLELEKEVAKVVESRPSFARAKVGHVMDKLTTSKPRPSGRGGGQPAPRLL